MTARNARRKVLYLAGWQRSGSTILSNILGQLQGFFSAGEIYYFWGDVAKDNVLCGCGVPLRECGLWSEVVHHAFGEAGVDAQRMKQLGTATLRTRNIPRFAFTRSRGKILDGLAEYVGNIDKLYAAIADTTGCAVIVDSSKWPAYGVLLSERPNLDVYVLHLVRDPRAVAYSWQRRKPLPDQDEGAFMYRTPRSSSARWLAWNAGIEVFWKRCSDRYMLVRYEDFVTEPVATVQQILDMLGEQPRNVELTAREVFLDVCHTVDGNPARFRTGLVRLAKDDEWETAMDARTRVAVTSMALPLLLHYRYPVTPGFRSRQG